MFNRNEFIIHFFAMLSASFNVLFAVLETLLRLLTLGKLILKFE
jgi:hypothetical protein